MSGCILSYLLEVVVSCVCYALSLWILQRSGLRLDQYPERPTCAWAVCSFVCTHQPTATLRMIDVQHVGSVTLCLLNIQSKTIAFFFYLFFLLRQEIKINKERTCCGEMSPEKDKKVKVKDSADRFFPPSFHQKTSDWSIMLIVCWVGGWEGQYLVKTRFGGFC